MKPSVQEQRCPICDWPMASSAEKGCVPGDCSYRPDDPAEQRRISERRKALSSVSTPAQDATALADAPNDAISAVMAEAYGMLGLELTLPQSRRLANAALRATSQTPDADDLKLTYVKRWRTIVKLPAKYANEIVEALRSTPSASAGPQAEAVAWRWRDRVYKDEWVTTYDDTKPEEDDRTRDLTPLYAHPQPQQADGRGAVIEALIECRAFLQGCVIRPVNIGSGDLDPSQVLVKKIDAALQQSPATDGPAK